MNIDGAALPDDDQLQLGFENLNTDLARVEASLPLPSAEDGAVPEDPKPAPEPAPGGKPTRPIA